MLEALLTAVNDQFGESTEQDYLQYQDNPALFAGEVLGEILTPDMIKLMKAVRDNQVVISKSGNAVGKTFIGALPLCQKKILKRLLTLKHLKRF